MNIKNILSPFKKIVAIAALCVAAAFTSQAQTVAYAGILTGGTNAVLPNTVLSYVQTNQVTNIVFVATNSTFVTNVVMVTNSVAAISGLNYVRMVDFQPSFALIGAGTAAVVFFLDNSTDGARWNVNATNFSVTPAGTTPVNPIYRLDTGSSLFWRVGGISNATANTAMTNVCIPIGKKQGF